MIFYHTLNTTKHLCDDCILWIRARCRNLLSVSSCFICSFCLSFFFFTETLTTAANDSYKGVARGGGGSGVPVTPLCKPFLSKQPTIVRWQKLDNLVSTLCLTQSGPPPPPPLPLKNLGHALKSTMQCVFLQGGSFLKLVIPKIQTFILLTSTNDRFLFG